MKQIQFNNNEYVIPRVYILESISNSVILAGSGETETGGPELA